MTEGSILKEDLNNLKCECTLQESAKISEIKADRTKRRNK